MKKVILAILLLSSASAFAASPQSRLLGIWGGLGYDMKYSVDGKLTFSSELGTESLSCTERPIEIDDLNNPASKQAEVVLNCKNSNNNNEIYFIGYYTSYNNESCMTLTSAELTQVIVRHLLCKK